MFDGYPKGVRPFRIFDLTYSEEMRLLGVARKIGINDKVKLLCVAEHAGIKTGDELINYIYVCVTYNIRPLELIRRD